MEAIEHILSLVIDREEKRRKKMWNEADEDRDFLTSCGVELEDLKNGFTTVIFPWWLYKCRIVTGPELQGCWRTG